MWLYQSELYNTYVASYDLTTISDMECNGEHLNFKLEESFQLEQMKSIVYDNERKLNQYLTLYSSKEFWLFMFYLLSIFSKHFIQCPLSMKKWLILG